MTRYIAGRLGWALVVILAMTIITFGVTFLSPVDPARLYAGVHASHQEYEAARRTLGLDQPVVVQYLRYLGRLVQGNLGNSFSTGQSVRSLVLGRLPATLELAAAGLLIEAIIGLPLGFLAATRWHRPADRAVLAGSLVGVVIPQFVLGFALLYLFAYKLPIFPLGATASLPALVLPALALGLPGAAWYARMVRSSVLNVLGEDFVRSSRAKGLSEWKVMSRHVFRNSIGPAITMLGLDFGIFLGGVLVVEQVFGWPGIGQQAWNAITANDIPVVLGTVIVATTAVVIFNLLADVANAVLDPRIRYA
ncbi:MAG TPA: ABC transporter permease [Solirubrobacteraceae bacterium]|nr:ABC transporter permease [Solirubrobacteraceae bacterium]